MDFFDNICGLTNVFSAQKKDYLILFNKKWIGLSEQSIRKKNFHSGSA
jgi:hypothetical protein